MKVTEFTSGRMEINMRANGNNVCVMEMVQTFLATVTVLSANTTLESQKAMECTNGKMAILIQAILSKV